MGPLKNASFQSLKTLALLEKIVLKDYVRCKRLEYKKKVIFHIKKPYHHSATTVSNKMTREIMIFTTATDHIRLTFTLISDYFTIKRLPL